MSHFRHYLQDQLFLLPPDIREWLPEDHLARFIQDAVDTLDLSAFIQAASDRDPRGNKAYHPKMMVSILLYAYCIGVPSSRKVEKRCVDDVAFRVLSGNTLPDHSTISEFRRFHLDALKGLFVQVLQLCQTAGLLKLGHVALDGTKVKANAALDRNLTPEKLLKTIEELGLEVAELLQKAEKTDAAEDDRERREGKDGLPEKLRKTQDRMAVLKAAHAELAAKAKAEAEQAALEAAEKAAQRAKEEEESGRKKRGRKPKPASDPEQAKPDETAKFNETDPDSRIMKDGRSKAFLQAFNAQAMVTEGQIIVVAEVTNEANDKAQLEPMVAAFEQVVRELEPVRSAEERLVVSADAGYFAEPAVKAVAEWVEALVSPDRKLGRCATATTSAAKKAMREKLEMPENKAFYQKRKVMVEPVFGQIKECRGFRRFSFRGEEKVDAEWKLISLTHNLLKVFRAGFCPKLALAR